MIGPQARLRLYTDGRQYRRLARSLITRGTAAGDGVKTLERDVAARCGAPHAIAVPMARVGLYFLMKALIGEKRRVVLSPYTISEVVNMVICAGGEPVFCDIDRATCNIDPEALARILEGPEADEIGVVLVTHFYGLVADMPAINALCAPLGIPVVEDAAQSFGATAEGRAAGTLGDAGVYSFGVYKNINSFFGGMVVTRDAVLAERVRHMVEALPQSPRGRLAKKMAAALQIDFVTRPPLFGLIFFRFFRWAFLNNIEAINNKLKIDVAPKLFEQAPPEYFYQYSDAQAALLDEQLGNVARKTRMRIENAARYHAGLRDIPDLILPPLRADGSHNYWYFPLQYDDSHALVKHVLSRGCDITISYHRNCADMPCFERWRRDCPQARATARSLIYLPVYPGYEADQIDRTVAAIRSYFGLS